MDIKIRKATEKDFSAIFGLITELAEYEESLDQVSNSLEQMYEQKDYFNCYVAETEENEIIGMALYYFSYYTWVGKTLYLDDLYVKEAWRGNGLGSRLMDKMFEVAKAEKCKRFRLQVLNWNEQAIKLYEKSGFTVDKTWYNCDFEDL
ncbi:GNAT family N-acetyltransferase [Draconibacterium halophilum]|uniref:GNAT family N-acetyltransferase n=1 Tax=Draconibacterium halophilum TaxID=2706887 RepID=A0A6C0RJX2_9BACT|nr:GNAT family N-acetyltransferase [Draconibacterium halophilum]QIA09531.1 GNAT family N-acetyltransferase [Draconibacterium halophilum]